MTADALAFVAVTATLAALAMAAMLLIALKANEGLARENRDLKRDLRIEHAHTTSLRSLLGLHRPTVIPTRILPAAVAGRMVWPDVEDEA